MTIENKHSNQSFSSWLLIAFPVQMMREKHKSSLNMHCERQTIVVKVVLDGFAFSLLRSMVLALIS
jgi:hypothetical protein